MMYSVAYADRDSTFYSQRNNPIDVYNQIIGKEGYLESCMPSMIVNACAALLPKEPIFAINGVRFQPEQLIWDMLNDRANWPALQQYREISDEQFFQGIVPSRVPQYAPFAAMKMFDLQSQFKWTNNFNLFDEVADNIIKGNSVGLQLISPAHYIAVVKYDPVKMELIYHDSAYGKNQKLSKEDTEINCTNFYIEFYP